MTLLLSPRRAQSTGVADPFLASCMAVCVGGGSFQALIYHIEWGGEGERRKAYMRHGVITLDALCLLYSH